MTAHRIALVHLPLAAAALVMTCLPARALAAEACSQWGVGSYLTLAQSNSNSPVTLKLQQTGTQFKGAADYYYNYDTGNLGVGKIEVRHTYGPIVGTVVGNQFEATIYWSNASVGVYTGMIGPQGLVVGRTYDKTDRGATADFHSGTALDCLKAVQSAPGPAAVPAKPTLALGRVQTPAGTPPSPPKTLCESAASARARNSPAAPSLEKRCTASLVANPVAAVPTPPSTNVPAAQSPPVTAPHDLAVGRITYKQDGKLVTQLVVGRPVEIACTYVVNEVAGPFVFKIQPWRGRIQIGGQAPMTLMFQGDPRGGQHETRELWMPSAAGSTPISCVLNAGFESLEANGKNNRWNETIDVAQAPSGGASSPLGAVPVARSVPLQLTAPAPASLSATAGKGNAVALKQPMLLPNTTAMQSPAAKPANKGNAVSLNPQPLPPASPLLLPNQAPGPLR